MASIVSLIIIACILSSALALDTNSRFDDRGRYNPNYNNPYYNSRYYKNYYNNRQYYDTHFKNYNPNVAGAQARILSQEMRAPDDGAYSYAYETENGIRGEERGVPIHTGKEEQKQVVEGSYSFVTPEGVHVLVRYTADENGFHPVITYGGADSEQYARRQQSADVIVTQA